MRRALALVLLAGCAGTQDTAAPPVTSGEPVRLVLRPVRAPEDLRPLAADIEAQICAIATAPTGLTLLIHRLTVSGVIGTSGRDSPSAISATTLPLTETKTWAPR